MRFHEIVAAGNAEMYSRLSKLSPFCNRFLTSGYFDNIGALKRCMQTTPVASVRAPLNANYTSQPYVKQEVIQNTDEEDLKFTKDVIGKVNDQIENKTHGRLFAVVHVAGKQHIVKAEDMIVVLGFWAPGIGDRIRLEKVLAVAGQDFTLIGQPLLHRDLVKVEATVIEKTLSHTRVFVTYIRRKNYRRTRFYREDYTMVRINSVEILHKVDELPLVEGVDGKIF